MRPRAHLIANRVTDGGDRLDRETVATNRERELQAEVDLGTQYRLKQALATGLTKQRRPSTSQPSCITRA